MDINIEYYENIKNNILKRTIEEGSKLDRTQVYKMLYSITKDKFLKEGKTEDKSSRLANIFAVKNTNNFFK